MRAVASLSLTAPLGSAVRDRVVSTGFGFEGSMGSRGSRVRAISILLVVGLLAGCSARPSARPQRLASAAGGPALCVTEGQVRPVEGGRLEVADPAMRAVAMDTGGDAGELEFTYEGPSQGDAPLANGELRRQIGLKLRAADTCNVVYVMWRLTAPSDLVVSVKRNPGMTQHAQCHDGGYERIKAARSEPVPEVREGETHRLRAVMSGDTLRVFADERLAWEGTLGENALGFDGPVGIRTDNGRFVFRIVGDRGSHSAECRGGELVAAG